MGLLIDEWRNRNGVYISRTNHNDKNYKNLHEKNPNYHYRHDPHTHQDLPIPFSEYI